jgi:hypothetical protein
MLARRQVPSVFRRKTCLLTVVETLLVHRLPDEITKSKHPIASLHEVRALVLALVCLALFLARFLCLAMLTRCRNSSSRTRAASQKRITPRRSNSSLSPVRPLSCSVSRAFPLYFHAHTVLGTAVCASQSSPSSWPPRDPPNKVQSHFSILLTSRFFSCHGVQAPEVAVESQLL